MPSEQLSALFLAPLTPFFGVFVILTGLYSLTFNSADARRKNHPRADRLARGCGWLYIIIGLGIVVLAIVFS